MKKAVIWLLSALFLSGILFAETGGDEGIDVSNPVETTCGSSGNIVDFTCNMMVALLKIGPFLAAIALVLGGIIYIYASIFVTADQRGRYHTLSTNLAIGGLILAALVGGVGIIINAGTKFLVS